MSVWDWDAREVVFCALSVRRVEIELGGLGDAIREGEKGRGGV